MKRNLKALGLALVAAFAMSAAVASAAQANFTQPDDIYPVALTGHEEGGPTQNFFSITSGAANPPRSHCQEVKSEGTLAEQSEELTITPHIQNAQ